MGTDRFISDSFRERPCIKTRQILRANPDWDWKSLLAKNCKTEKVRFKYYRKIIIYANVKKNKFELHNNLKQNYYRDEKEVTENLRYELRKKEKKHYKLK